MAGHGDGEDFFSEDAFDDLPEEAFDELERNALRQTQSVQFTKAPASSNYGDEFDDDDLDDAEVYDAAKEGPVDLVSTSAIQRHHDVYQQNNFSASRARSSIHAGWPPPNPSLAHRVTSAVTIKPQDENYGQWTDSQSETLGDHNFDPGSNIEQEAQRQIVGGVPVASKQIKKNQEAQSNNQRAAAKVSDNQDRTDLATAQQDDITLLQRQLQEALLAQSSLRQELNSKAGEISIVRSKQEKAAKEHEIELTATRKLHAERLAQQQRELESAREAQKTTATELEFLRQDLVEESEKVRNLKRAKDRAPGNVRDLTVTPKKPKAYRDGFDDDEILMSPSKFQGKRSNPNTPTKAAKKKRKAPESPSLPLELSIEQQPSDQQSGLLNTVFDESLLEKLRQSDDSLEFLELVFDHRPSRNRLRTIEEFSSISFPNGNRESFAASILGKLPLMSRKNDSAAFAIEICEHLVSLWDRCLAEKFYKPIYLLLDLVTFIVELKAPAIASHVMDSVLTIAQLTADLVAIPRFQRAAIVEHESLIDVSACLELIHLLALGCIGDHDDSVRVWQIIRLDFILMMLSQHQLPRDFDLTLQLLALSAMVDSFGPRLANQDEQKKHASYILDRVSFLLNNVSTLPEGQERHGPLVVSNLRIRILMTLEAFCQIDWGTEAVALHKLAIGRVVKLMSDELDVLYNHHSGHRQSARIICLSVRILHHIVARYDRTINMQHKLREIPGGVRKYTISLARLTYSEDGLVLGADIYPEIADCAQELLDLIVIEPEEANDTYAAFVSQ